MIQGEMPEESFKVHGLSTDFLSNKPLFSEIVENFINFIGGSKLIIHNAKFDIGFINYEIHRLGISNEDIYENLPYKEIKYENVIDTWEIAKKLYPGKSVSLDSLCIKFGINNKRKGNHGALIDTEILSEVYLELVRGNNQDFSSLSLNTKLKNSKTTLEKKNFSRRNTLKEIDCPKEKIFIKNSFLK